MIFIYNEYTYGYVATRIEAQFKFQFCHAYAYIKKSCILIIGNIFKKENKIQLKNII